MPQVYIVIVYFVLLPVKRIEVINTCYMETLL